MTLRREYKGGPFVVQCDICGDAEELEAPTFGEAKDEAKAEGYRPSFDNGAWLHACSYCSQNLP